MSDARPSNNVPTIQRHGSLQLSHSQHSRLVKSTRKVTKLLGENPGPQVNLSSTASIPRKQSWESNIAAKCSPILSVTRKLARAALDPLQKICRRDPDTDSESMCSCKSGAAEMTTLSHESSLSSSPVLQPESHFEPEMDDYASPISPQAPSPTASLLRKRRFSLASISTKSLLLSQAEWEKWKEEREAHRCRKRFAKLARHLGEGIPPDLVLPKPEFAKPTVSRASSRRRRLLAALVPPVRPVIPRQEGESPTSEQETPVSISPPSTLSDVPGPAVEKTVEVFRSNKHASLSADAELPSQFARRRWHSQSEFSISLTGGHSMHPHTYGYFEVDDHADAISVEQPESYRLMVQSPAPRTESRLAFLRLRSPASSPTPDAVSHRSERRQGWSGEWNAANMQDVITKLRDL
ncbi:hypothetical protein BJV74DRAFT_599277 [Russula compacta]|nr:hypothetical protein BJV74DRAFT_599277 [Russula compacta]